MMVKIWTDVGSVSISQSVTWEPLDFIFSLSNIIGTDAPLNYTFNFYCQSSSATVEFYADFILMVSAENLIQKTSLITDGSFEIQQNLWGQQGYSLFKRKSDFRVNSYLKRVNSRVKEFEVLGEKFEVPA